MNFDLRFERNYLFLIRDLSKIRRGEGGGVEIFTKAAKIKRPSIGKGLKCLDPRLELILKFSVKFFQ